jgi:hypothetical protein
MNSITPEYEDIWQVKDTFQRDKTVRANLNGFYLYEYIDNQSCRISAYAHVDPKVSAVPDSIINFVSKQTFVQGFKKILAGEVFKT